MTAPDHRLRALVFDVDGTLAETERTGHRLAYNQAFAELGLPHEWDEQLYGELLLTAGGLPRTVGFLRSTGVSPRAAEDVGRLVHDKAVAHFLHWVHSEAQLRPGLERLLAEAVGEGVRLGVATAGRAAWVQPFLATVVPGITFSAVVTFDDVDRLKPDPQVYQVAVSRLGIAPHEAMAVEDSAVGLQSALAAGLTCAVVPAHYTVDQDFSGAALVASSFADVTLGALRQAHATAAQGRR